MSLITHLFNTNLHIFDKKTTGTKEFRELVDEVATLMAFEITRDMTLEEIEIETPVSKMKSRVLSGKKIGLSSDSCVQVLAWWMVF